MTYDDWKLETPEDEEERHAYETRAWTRRLYGRPMRDPDEARDDHWEECLADWQRTGEDE